jgi:VanZ family protein
MKRLLNRVYYWLPPLLLMAVVFYLSAQPDLPHAPGEALDAFVKKLAHAGEFALLFMLLSRALRRDMPLSRSLDISWLLTATYAVSDELHQSFVPGRHAKVSDVVIDVCGALLLWAFLRGRLRYRLWRRRNHDLSKELLLTHGDAPGFDQLQQRQKGDNDL